MDYPRSRIIAVGLTAALAVAPLAAVTSAGASAALSPADSPRRVIVVLDGAAAAAAQPQARLKGASASAVNRSRVSVSTAQDGLVARLRAAGIRPSDERKHTLLVNAVTMTVPASQVDALKRQPGVAGVFANARVKVQTDVSVPLVGAPTVWKQQDSAGVGVTGKGVTVAVIDSGIDYSHPDLGAGFGEGHKVVGGYDFVNDDDDPMDDHGHGTHVAGIIAAKAAESGGITGMAPDASLTAYKVADQYGYGDTEDLVSGIEAAVDPAGAHPADVLNISMGSPGDGTDPVSLAATAAVRGGTVVVASAGNEGPYSDTVSSPSVADGVISVGASASNIVTPYAYLGGERLQTYKGALSARPDTRRTTAALVDVGTGTTEELDAAGDLNGKVVLWNGFVAPDPGSFFGPDLDTQREIERRGAVALLGGYPAAGGGIGISAAEIDKAAENGDVVGRATSPDTGGTTLHDAGQFDPMSSLVLMGIDSSQYAELARALAAGPVSLGLEGADETDRIASFSSRGPTQQFGLKPDIVAPGVEILSTVPRALVEAGEYRMSGTSMASPHVAGAAALLHQLRPSDSPALVKAALMGTSKQLADTDPTAGGAGRLDVAAAAKRTLTAYPPSLSLGLANQAKETLGVTAALTLQNPTGAKLVVDLSADSAQATVSPRRVTLNPGASTSVIVKVTAPRPTGWAEISGTITAKVEGFVVTHVPYLLVSRGLDVNFTDDPNDGHTTAYIYTPTALRAAPTLTLDPDQGRTVTIKPEKLSDNYYRADVSVTGEGAYAASVRGTTTNGAVLVGRGGFAVTEATSRRSKWTPVGPNSIGGELTVAPSNPTLAVLAEDNTVGPWLTTDGGKTWKQLGGLPVSETRGRGHVVIDRDDAKEFFYALLDANAGYSKLLHTTDAGKTWQTLELPGQVVISSLVSDPAGRVLVAATTSNELLVSSDRGRSWNVSTTVPAGYPSGIAISGTDLYVNAGQKVYKRPGVTTGTPGEAVLVQDFGRTGIVYEIAADDTAVVYTVLGQGVFAVTGGAAPVKVLDRPSGFSGLFVSRGDVFVGGLDGVANVSRDHGATWTDVPQPSDIAAMLDYDRWADGTITMTTTAGVYRSATDGSGSHRIGVAGADVADLVTAGDHLLAATPTGVYRTVAPAASTEWGAADGEGSVGLGAQHLAVSPADSSVVFKTRGSVFGGTAVDRSTDGGQSWQEVGASSGSPTALAVSAADPNRVFAGFYGSTGSGLLASKDGGQTWKSLYLGMPVDAITPDPVNPLRVWIGNTSGLWRSDDGGVTVTRVATGRVTSIAIDGKRMLVGGDAVKVSQDGGASFTASDMGSIPVHVTDVVKVGGTWFASSSGFVDIGYQVGPRGVYKSTNGGRTWKNVSSGLQSIEATSLTASADRAWLYVGTAGGVHRLKLK